MRLLICVVLSIAFCTPSMMGCNGDDEPLKTTRDEVGGGPEADSSTEMRTPPAPDPPPARR